MLLEDLLGQALSLTELQRERWSAGVGDPVEVEGRGHRRLQPGIVVEELDHIEDDVGPTPPEDPLQLLEVVLQIHRARAVTGFAERFRDRLVLLVDRRDVGDRVFRLELELADIHMPQLLVPVFPDVIVEHDHTRLLGPRGRFLRFFLEHAQPLLRLPVIGKGLK